MKTSFPANARSRKTLLQTLPAAAFVVALSFGQGANAADSATAGTKSATSGADNEDGFTASFGVGVGRNSLTGTSDKAKAFPLFSIDWQSGAFFAGLSKGIGYHVVQSEALTLTTSLTPAAGRKESESARFKGLGDVKASGAANIAAEFTPGGMPFAVTGGYTKAFGKNTLADDFSALLEEKP